MNVADKVVVITGASSGIGRACAIDMVRAGAKVVLASRNELELCAVADSVDPSGRRTLVVPTDVTNPEQCQQLIAETLSYFGHLDVLINNAGISMRADFDKVDIKVLHEVMNVNFWGTVYCTKAALPHLLASHGTIVGVSSVAGHIGLPGRTGYSASKFAMRGFLETIRNEYLHTGLKVFIIAPSYTTSNVRKAALTANGTPQGSSPLDEERLMSAEKVAKAIRKGIESERRFRVLSFVEGWLALWLNKWCPSVVSKIVSKKIIK